MIYGSETYVSGLLYKWARHNIINYLEQGLGGWIMFMDGGLQGESGERLMQDAQE